MGIVRWKGLLFYLELLGATVGYCGDVFSLRILVVCYRLPRVNEWFSVSLFCGSIIDIVSFIPIHWGFRFLDIIYSPGAMVKW